MNPTVKIVVFDLGGVMVRIARTWGEAAERAGLRLGRPDTANVRLPDLPGFEDYQAQRLGWEGYLDLLVRELGLASSQEAEAIHGAILIEPYPGTLEFVMELESQGIRTACLSNTNDAHWHLLRSANHYPAIARLEVAIASHIEHVGKPNPELYRILERSARVLPNEIVFFDDHQENVTRAIELGWHAFTIDPFGDPAQQMRGYLGLS